jgi:hypothetical protein
VGTAIDRSGRGETRAWFSVALEGGAESGFIGGIVLLLARLLAFSELAFFIVWISPSRDPMLARVAKSVIWIALKWPAYPFVGERALVRGFDAGVVALGVVAHFTFALTWGLLFGLAACGRSPRVTVALGFLWGVLGAVAEGQMLARFMGGGLVVNPAIALVFLGYGYVLARSFLLFEKKRQVRRWT